MLQVDFSPAGYRYLEINERNRMSTAVTESTFDQEVLSSDKPVIVDFWAEWCGPCHAVSPVLDKIAEERSGELKLVKVNIDEEQGLAERYGIASIPTIVLFKDGEPAAAAIGAQPKGAIEKQLGLDVAEPSSNGSPSE
jgi:thioredoxin 1